MVLSAPAAHAAPPAAPWLDRLSRIFQLGRGRGVMVLVRGGPGRLGEVVRCVVGLSPDACVLMNADALASLAPGSTAVLCLRPQDFDWLNIGRPVVLGHRVVLFGDAATALALEQRAVDFCDWISHRIDAPPGPPPFAVRAFKNAVCSRSPAVMWKGGDIDPVFSEVLPGRSLSRVSAAQPYADLVTALRPRPKTWALVTDLDDSFRTLRVSWAVAEAGRYGRTILMQPGVEARDLPVVQTMPVPIEDAVATLSRAGIEHGARLAALVDLAPDAIERAAAMAESGASEAEIEERAAELTQPWIPPRDTSSRGLPGWSERVELALRHGDDEVALYWTTLWRAAEPENARATATLAYVRVRHGDFDGARALQQQANEQAGPHPDADTAFELHRLEGLICANERRPEKALRAFEDAIRLLRKTQRSPGEADELYLSRVRSLMLLGRLEEAERTIQDWPARTHAGDDDTPQLFATAILKLARGESEDVIPILRRMLDRLEERDSWYGDVLARMLSQALLARGDFDDAERLTHAATLKAEQRGRNSAYLRHEHARALVGLGRFVEAEREFMQVLTSVPPGADAAVTRYHLARCLSAQGRLDEAEPMIDEAIAELVSSPPRDHSTYVSMLHEKGRIYFLRGSYKEAATLLREVLREEERALGRDHPTLVQTLTGLGDSLIQSGEPGLAQPYLRRAQRLAERAGHEAGLAVALGNLAVAEAMQRFPQAAHTARRALNALSRSGREASSTVRADLEAIAAGGLASRKAPPPKSL